MKKLILSYQQSIIYWTGAPYESLFECCLLLVWTPIA